MKKFIYILLVISIFLTGCSEKKSEPISDTQFVLGTVASIQIRDHGTQEILDDSFQILENIEQRMSTSIEGSDIWNINKGSGNGWVKTDDQTRYVIEKAMEYGALSEGRFDITMGPVVDLWGIGSDRAHIPAKEEIADALKRVDYKKVEMDDNLIRIEKGMAIDLGAIAKGYAADQVAEFLRTKGVKSAIINLGGNVKVLGSKDNNKVFKIGIQSPFDARNDYFGIVSLINQSVVSSGDYERFFEQDGIRYHHIFDSNTGYPVATDVAQVTVITEESIAADALSTILFSMTIEEGLEMTQSLDGVEVIYVTKDYQIYLSRGVKEKFELTDKKYELIETD
jgi:thiamine biosynthesis lipoprotein